MKTLPSKFATPDSFSYLIYILRAWIHSVTHKLRGNLILGLVGQVIEDYDFLWDEYYFSTATL